MTPLPVAKEKTEATRLNTDRAERLSKFVKLASAAPTKQLVQQSSLLEISLEISLETSKQFKSANFEFENRF